MRIYNGPKKIAGGGGGDHPDELISVKELIIHLLITKANTPYATEWQKGWT